ncbi:MAG: hypothetical protein Q9165_007318 [Trypethelium subeluteriae]
MDASLHELRSVVHGCPVIDNHAHNLLLPDKLHAYEFATITTEAQGAALEDTYTSLSHIRGVNQLKELYGCDKDADWNSVLARRAQVLTDDPLGLVQKCLEGTHTILMDDGLDADTVHPYTFHDQFTIGKTRRIVRIEAEAQDAMRMLMENPDRKFSTDSAGKDSLWVEFAREFEQRIKNLILDPEVVGFKSVVCYRTGLDVEPEHLSESALGAAIDDFHLYVDNAARGQYRIEHKGVNDFLVGGTLQLLSSSRLETGMSKPIQFHTGLGDPDINLLRSNPAYLQAVIEKYPHVPFVILHSSYPYTREAGYLATVFKNAYLDVGEVFPMLSRDGQLSVLRQALELTPTSKLLWSTDGHWFPETYWLANRQFRQAFEQVLTGYVNDGDLSLAQAIDAAKAIMYRNSNILYSLKLPDDPMEASGRKLLTEKAIYPAQTRNSVPVPALADKPTALQDVQALEDFQAKHGQLEYVFISWLDYTATTRTRIFPIAEFQRLTQTGTRFAISNGTIGILANDALTPACDTTGVIHIEPDLSTLSPNHLRPPSSATVLASWRDASGHPHPACPRSTCQTLLTRLLTAHHLNLTLGFEIEVCFLHRSARLSSPISISKPFSTPLDSTHAWSTLSPHSLALSLPLLHAIASALAAADIPLTQFHAESNAGEFEFVLPPRPALAAIDTLLHARRIIASVAEAHGLRATLHPRPVEGGAGTGAHVHASLEGEGEGPAGEKEEMEEKEMRFWTRGVLSHLGSICAFTLPIQESYSRVADDSWSGGRWVAWGTQNREVPLRRIPGEGRDGKGGRWEVRCVDGLANMYFAVAAIVAAGMLGLEAKGEAEVPAKDCLPNPSKLTAEQRAEYGIHVSMPSELGSALSLLEENSELASLLGEKLVSDYVTVKRTEDTMLAEMSDEERRNWLMERY